MAIITPCKNCGIADREHGHWHLLHCHAALIRSRKRQIIVLESFIWDSQAKADRLARTIRFQFFTLRDLIQFGDLDQVANQTKQLARSANELMQLFGL